MRRIAFLLALFLASTFARPVRAYEERTTIELGLAPTLRLAPDFVPGGAADFILTWGVGQMWSVGGSARYSWNHDDSMRNVLIPAFEVTWSLDILRWVPRVTLGAGPAFPLERRGRPMLDLELRLGLDRLTDHGLYGFDLRLDVYGAGDPGGAGRLTLSLGFRWGFVIDRF